MILYLLMPQPVRNRISFPCLNCVLEVQHFFFQQKKKENLSICILVIRFFLLAHWMLHDPPLKKMDMRFYLCYFLFLQYIKSCVYIPCLISFNNPISAFSLSWFPLFDHQTNDNPLFYKYFLFKVFHHSVIDLVVFNSSKFNASMVICSLRTLSPIILCML